jgi:hypothetical protein
VALLEVLNLSAVLLLTLAAIGLYINQRKLFAAIRKAHPNGYPDPYPTAAAVVTPAPASGPREAPARLPEPAHARAALASDARERQLPPGSAPAPSLDTEGDRAGINPGSPVPTEAREEPAPDTDREPRPMPLEVARALGAPVGMVGLSLDESDAAQAPEVPVRRTLRAEAPSEPPPAGVPVPADDPEADARWRRTLRRHPIMDEVTVRGLARTQAPDVATLMPISPNELETVDRMATTRGISREAMLELLAATGIAGEERRAGPTTPPGAPANDADEGQPPSGRRRG